MALRQALARLPALVVLTYCVSVAGLIAFCAILLFALNPSGIQDPENPLLCQPAAALCRHTAKRMAMVVVLPDASTDHQWEFVEALAAHIESPYAWAPLGIDDEVGMRRPDLGDGGALHGVNPGLAQSPVSIIFYYRQLNNAAGDLGSRLRAEDDVVGRLLTVFNAVGSIMYRTNPVDPLSHAVSQLVLKKAGRTDILPHYDYVFFTDQTFVPKSHNWLRKLYTSAMCGPEFWIRGSVVSGDVVQDPDTDPTASAVPRIDTGAILNVGDEAFRDFLADASSPERYGGSDMGHAADLGFSDPFAFDLWRDSRHAYNPAPFLVSVAHEAAESWEEAFFSGSFRSVASSDRAHAFDAAFALRGTGLVEGDVPVASLGDAEHAHCDLSFRCRVGRLALVVPVAEDTLDDVVAALRDWELQVPLNPADPLLSQPNSAPPGLFFYWTGTQGGQDQEQTLRDEIAFLPHLRSSIGYVGFIEAPPRVHPLLGLLRAPGKTSSVLGDYYDYMAFLPPSAKPVRPHWLSDLVQEALCSEPFWVRGSGFRGTYSEYQDLVAEVQRESRSILDTAAAAWIHEAALYSLRDARWHSFLADFEADPSTNLAQGWSTELLRFLLRDRIRAEAWRSAFVQTPAIAAVGAERADADLPSGVAIVVRGTSA